jgi:hypothetical protein
VPKKGPDWSRIAMSLEGIDQNRLGPVSPLRAARLRHFVVNRFAIDDQTPDRLVRRQTA